ncbi:four-carbon acid sugar kinase family protein [Leucobacter tardus]|uniref:3-oxo-tetronate kinase n=1 Tax=Leucobacter tardus TaxID=501483 RepID=A0A939TRZ2_9MICO|nr:3-oxo-tetronate kinase [Leucobacter tardus]MBO2990537.1 four-carbon acid sugar kinase family protein [Leucobacter tardus]
MLEWGGVADDFTGATDLATNWRARGLRVAVLLGVDHSPADLDGVDGAVIALKSRTAPVTDAVSATRAAARLLRDAGAPRIYDKYCSTFDSTAAGNIGPVLDALATDLGADRTVVVPAFPDAGRTVYQRRLFVFDELLESSHMRHHPLTPMTRSDVTELLTAQSDRSVGWVSWRTVQEGAVAIRAAIDAVPARSHVVVDAVSNADLAAIAAATANDVLVSGGSGLALGLPLRHAAAAPMPVVEGFRAVLAGSASHATQGQVAHARESLPSARLDTAALTSDFTAEIDRLTAWAAAQWADAPRRPVLVYATGAPEDVGDGAHAALIEAAHAELAVAFTARGMRQLLVAGGETSGSVMQRLGVTRLDLGDPVAPGLSWARGRAAAHGGDPLNLLLKSGNFGGSDLFTAAWEHLR